MTKHPQFDCDIPSDEIVWLRSEVARLREEMSAAHRFNSRQTAERQSDLDAVRAAERAAHEATKVEQEGVITCLNSDIAGALADRKSLEAEVARLREELGLRAQQLDEAGRVAATERAAREETKAELEKAQHYVINAEACELAAKERAEAAEARVVQLMADLDQTRGLLLDVLGNVELPEELANSIEIFCTNAATSTPAAMGTEPRPYVYCERCKTLAGAVCGICRQARQTPAEKEQGT